MDSKTLGTLCFILGLALVIVSAIALRRNGGTNNKADRGGVIVGGDNKGLINTGKINSGSSLWKWLGRIGTLASILGIFIALRGD